MSTYLIKPGEFVVVTKGHHIGIFYDQASLDIAIVGHKKADYQVFENLEDASDYFGSSGLRTFIGINRSDSVLPIAKTKKQKRSAKRNKRKKQRQNKGRNKSVSRNHPQILSTIGVDPSCQVHIFTDGSSTPYRGPSASGVAVYLRNKILLLVCGYYDVVGTCNRAELKALKMALQIAGAESFKQSKIQILSDSTYAIFSINRSIKKFQVKGWDNPKVQKVTNISLIKEVYDAYLLVQDQVIFTHVKAHSGVEGNELADHLAKHARREKITDGIRYTNMAEAERSLPVKLQPCFLKSIRQRCGSGGVR